MLAASLPRAMADREIASAIFFPLFDSQIENAASQKLLPLASGFQLTLRKSNRLLKPADRLKGVLVFSAGDSGPDHSRAAQAYSIDVPVAKRGTTKSRSAAGTRDKQSSPLQSRKEETQI